MRRVILGDIQAKTTFFSAQEGIDRPVLAIDLAPERAPVLQLGQRLQLARAGLDGAQVCPADARQIDDRCLTGEVNLFKRSGYGALEPDGWAGARCAVKNAQR